MSRAQELLLQIKSMSARQESSHRYGPAKCRADQLAIIARFQAEETRLVFEKAVQVAEEHKAEIIAVGNGTDADAHADGRVAGYNDAVKDIADSFRYLVNNPA